MLRGAGRGAETPPPDGARFFFREPGGFQSQGCGRTCGLLGQTARASEPRSPTAWMFGENARDPVRVSLRTGSAQRARQPHGRGLGKPLPGARIMGRLDPYPDSCRLGAIESVGQAAPHLQCLGLELFSGTAHGSVRTYPLPEGGRKEGAGNAHLTRSRPGPCSAGRPPSSPGARASPSWQSLDCLAGRHIPTF